MNTLLLLSRDNNHNIGFYIRNNKDILTEMSIETYLKGEISLHSTLFGKNIAGLNNKTPKSDFHDLVYFLWQMD
jgi:hypothetical protein